MRSLFHEKRKRLWIIIFTCLFMAVGCMAGKFFVTATNGVSPAATITYTPSSDMLRVSGYKFYTTSNASKKVPAVNYWIRTDANSDGVYGYVDLSGMPNATVLYFSKTATPASTDEILAVQVPAQPVLSKIKYKPAETKTVENKDGDEEEVDGDIADKFEFYTKLKPNKAGGQTVEVPVDPKYIQVRLNDNGEWKTFNTAVTKTVLEKMQRHGRTMYVRIVPASEVLTTTAVNDVRQILDRSIKVDGVKTARLEEVSKGNTEAASTIVRPGVSKVLKIKRKAFGPVVSIDYANHALNIKAGQACGSTSEAVEPKAWTIAEEAGKFFFGTNGSVTAAMVYGLKKIANPGKGVPESLTTFFKVPKDKPLLSYDESAEKNETYVSVTGTLGEDAVLKIQNKYAGSAISFQYAVVDLKAEGDNYGLLNGTKFNYKEAVEQLGNGDLKWYLLKTVKSTGKGMAKLPAEMVAGKQILVRRSAAGKEYSSNVEVFRAPSEKGKGWYKITQLNFADSFLTGSSPTGTCACPYANIEYKVDAKIKNQFKITRSSGASGIVADKLSVKIGDNNKIPFTIASDVVTLTGITEFEKGQNVEFTFREGAMTASAACGLTNAEYKITVVPNP